MKEKKSPQNQKSDNMFQLNSKFDLTLDISSSDLNSVSKPRTNSFGELSKIEGKNQFILEDLTPISKQQEIPEIGKNKKETTELNIKEVSGDLEDEHVMLAQLVKLSFIR